MRTMFALILTRVFIAGCDQAAQEDQLGEQAKSMPVKDRFVWDVENWPYKVLLSETNDANYRQYVRTVTVVYPDPNKEEVITEALKEIYTELKRDIEEIDANSKHQVINIKLYDSEGDSKHDREGFFTFIQYSPESGEKLSQWPPPGYQFHWRDPKTRPSKRDRELEWEFIAALYEHNKQFRDHILLSDEVGKSSAERRKLWEDKYPEKSTELKTELGERYGLSPEDVDQTLKRIVAWKDGES